MGWHQLVAGYAFAISVTLTIVTMLGLGPAALRMADLQRGAISLIREQSGVYRVREPEKQLMLFLHTRTSCVPYIGVAL